MRVIDFVNSPLSETDYINKICCLYCTNRFSIFFMLDNKDNKNITITTRKRKELSRQWSINVMLAHVPSC